MIIHVLFISHFQKVQYQLYPFNCWHMQGTNEYHYDFSYSVAFENINLQDLQGVDDLEKDFFQWYEILSSMHVIAQSEASRSNNILFKIPIFKRLGLQLFGLCVCTQRQISLQQKNNQIQKYRQSIYMCLQQLDQVAGKQKSKYLNTIIVCLYAIIQRTLQDIFNIQDQFLLFHTIYWELKGQLTNKQTMENLIMKTFNIQEFHKFMYWSKDDLQAKYSKNVQKVCQPVEPLTFRASSNRINENNNIMYQSFRQISMNRSSASTKIQKKENEQINKPKQDKQLNQKQLRKQKINLDIFRKKPQYNTTQEGQRPLYKAQQNNTQYGAYGSNPNTKLEQRIFASKIQNVKNNTKFSNFNTGTFKPLKLEQSEYNSRN